MVRNWELNPRPQELYQRIYIREAGDADLECKYDFEL
jgi:hypothetical protein